MTARFDWLSPELLKPRGWTNLKKFGRTRPPADNLGGMDIAALSSGMSTAETMNAKDVALLKKTQDLAKSMSQQLLETLPPAGGVGSGNPPGMGGLVDILA
jgi:Putative motility protein